jgi:hypothetical protein
MTYKLKIKVLTGVIGALALILVFSFIFDPERVNSRSSMYSWLDASQKDAIDRITIDNGNEAYALVFRNGSWYVSTDGNEYPAKQLRVEDFITALTKKAPYPVRSSSSASHERLSLTEGSPRITVTGGAGLPLLDFFIGNNDTSGTGIYMRKQGQNEIRTGEDVFTSFVGSNPNSWYNLRLFPETESGKLSLSSVQRLTVYPPADEDGKEIQPFIFTRRGRAWTSTVITDPDSGKMDSYIQEILNTLANNFVEKDPKDPDLNDCSVLLELGDGTIKTLRMGPDIDGSRNAVVSGSNMVYSVPNWAVNRLFPDVSDFEKPN